MQFAAPQMCQDLSLELQPAPATRSEFLHGRDKGAVNFVVPQAYSKAKAEI